MRTLVICRILLAAAALIASPSPAQRSERGQESDPPAQAGSEPRESVDSRDSSPPAESPPTPAVEATSPARDDPAPAPAGEASSRRSERSAETEDRSKSEAGRTTEPGLSPHYRQMEERNQRRYERERHKDEDRDGGTERRHHGDGGDDKGEHRRHHHQHRYVDGGYDGVGFYDDDSRASEEIAMPAVGMRFDPEVCSLFTGVSGLLRNLFGNHRCRILDATRYGLPEPGPGRLWLRVLKDAVLVDGSDGRVVDIVRNAVR